MRLNSHIIFSIIGLLVIFQPLQLEALLVELDWQKYSDEFRADGLFVKFQITIQTGSQSLGPIPFNPDGKISFPTVNLQQVRLLSSFPTTVDGFVVWPVQIVGPIATSSALLRLHTLSDIRVIAEKEFNSLVATDQIDSAYTLYRNVSEVFELAEANGVNTVPSVWTLAYSFRASILDKLENKRIADGLQIVNPSAAPFLNLYDKVAVAAFNSEQVDPETLAKPRLYSFLSRWQTFTYNTLTTREIEPKHFYLHNADDPAAYRSPEAKTQFLNELVNSILPVLKKETYLPDITNRMRQSDDKKNLKTEAKAALDLITADGEVRELNLQGFEKLVELVWDSANADLSGVSAD